MSAQTLPDLTDSLFDNVRAALGPVWDDQLTPAERELIRACCADAAELEVRALAAPRTREAQLELLREKAQIQAQLANLAAAGATRVADAFWDAVRAAVNGAVTIAFAAV